MEAGILPPVASMLEAGSQTQSKLQETIAANRQKGLQTAGAEYIGLSQTRLVIEIDRDQGGWVYKTVDAKNGQLLAQYPLRSAWEIILSQRSGLGLVVDAKI